MARIYESTPTPPTSPLRGSSPECSASPQLIDTVRFYEQLTQARLDMDMDIPEAGVHFVAVGPFLILELNAAQHGLAAQTTVTVLNADLDEAVARQVTAGAEIVQERWTAPVGAGTRLRHPDGLIVEYLEHRPTDDDVPEPGPALV